MANDPFDRPESRGMPFVVWAFIVALVLLMVGWFFRWPW